MQQFGDFKATAKTCNALFLAGRQTTASSASSEPFDITTRAKGPARTG